MQASKDIPKATSYMLVTISIRSDGLEKGIMPTLVIYSTLDELMKRHDRLSITGMYDEDYYILRLGYPAVDVYEHMAKGNFHTTILDAFRYIGPSELPRLKDGKIDLIRLEKSAVFYPNSHFVQPEASRSLTFS